MAGAPSGLGTVADAPGWREPGVTGTGWRSCWPTAVFRCGRSTARTAPAGDGAARAIRLTPRTPRAVLAGEATAIPKDREGFVGELRFLLLTSRSAVKPRTLASNQIKTFLLDADNELRQQLGRLHKVTFVRACAGLAPSDPVRRAIASLGRRWLTLNTEARDLEKQIMALLTAHTPELLTSHGIGAITAAQLLATCHANPQRLRSDAALAAECGASPVDAPSGKTTRHRLNRGGDRAANNALWVIANVRLGSDPRTQAFLAKRTATGNSHKEIMRMLQRYIARERYPLIIDALRPAVIYALT